MFGVCISVLFLLLVYFYMMYLREFIKVAKVYKSLRKLLEARDILVLKLLPDIKNPEISNKILNLINERQVKSKVSYDDGINADIALFHELKRLYEVIDKMDRDELQTEVFKHIINLEMQIKSVRKRYSEAVNEYNLSLTIHPKVLIKWLHMRPFELYK